MSFLFFMGNIHRLALEDDIISIDFPLKKDPMLLWRKGTLLRIYIW